MASKIIIVCMAVCLAQTITSRHINTASNILTGNTGQFNVNSNFENTINAGQITAPLNIKSGGIPAKPGILTVTSTSPIYPSGLSVYAENILLEGPLAVSGQVPFLGAIGFEGSLDTAGQGVGTCGCGDGNIGIVKEGLPSSRR